MQSPNRARTFWSGYLHITSRPRPRWVCVCSVLPVQHRVVVWGSSNAVLFKPNPFPLWLRHPIPGPGLPCLLQVTGKFAVAIVSTTVVHFPFYKYNAETRMPLKCRPTLNTLFGTSRHCNKPIRNLWSAAITKIAPAPPTLLSLTMNPVFTKTWSELSIFCQENAELFEHFWKVMFSSEQGWGTCSLLTAK